MAKSHWTRNTYGEIVVKFGKHNGSKLHELPNTYLEWMIKKFADGEGFDDDEEMIVEAEKEMAHRKKHSQVIEA